MVFAFSRCTKHKKERSGGMVFESESTPLIHRPIHWFSEWALGPFLCRFIDSLLNRPLFANAECAPFVFCWFWLMEPFPLCLFCAVFVNLKSPSMMIWWWDRGSSSVYIYNVLWCAPYLLLPPLAISNCFGVKQDWLILFLLLFVYYNLRKDRSLIYCQ